MAHFKRGYPRTAARRAIRGSKSSWRAKYGFKPVRLDFWSSTLEEWVEGWRSPDGRGMMNSYPAWWDRLFHTRPARSKAKRLAADIRASRRDPDNTCWPDHRKPHIYYW